MARYRRAVRTLRRVGLEKPIHALIGSMYAVETEAPVFHLTFDDGPHPEVTPAVLDALDEYRAPSTFFVLTREAEKYPELVRETIDRGHTIALHTRTHARLSEVSMSQLVDEVVTAKRDLEKVAGTAVTWFRPPFGSEGVRTKPVVRFARLRTLGWSADSHDWKGRTHDNALGNTYKNIAPGGIALLHDVPVGTSTAEDRDNGFISKDDLTRALLAELKKQDLRPVSLDELVESGPARRRAKLA